VLVHRGDACEYARQKDVEIAIVIDTQYDLVRYETFFTSMREIGLDQPLLRR
jgi:hypothetical protein